MVRIRTNDIFITNDDKIIFGDDFDSEIFWDSSVVHPTTSGDLRLTTTVSGVDPIESYHLTTKWYVDQAVGSGIGITDHGLLTGLEDDDHLLYVPRTGIRGFTSTVSGVYPVESYHLTTKEYVDSLITVPSGLFGGENAFAASDAESSTNSITFVEKLSVITEAVPSGTYRIGFTWEWRHSKSNTNFLAEVQIDDTIDIYSFDSSPIVDVNTWRPVTGFHHEEALSSGVHNVDVDFASSSAGSTSYIRNVEIEFWRTG